jgi:hypothetical protein
MLCVVIGIVPPLDDSTRIGFLKHATIGMGKTRICWAGDTLRESWVVPDEDAEDIPTMLFSAFLSYSDSNDDNENDGYCYDNDLRTTPEEFASFIQNELNHQVDENENEYRCEVWASAPAPLPLIIFGGVSGNCGDDGSSVTETKSPPDSTDIQNNNSELQRLQSDFRQKGLCLLPNILSSSSNKDNDSQALLLSKIRSMVDEAIHEAEASIASNHPSIEVGEDDFLFREIAARSKQRFDLLISKETDLYQLVLEHVLENSQTKLPKLLQKLFLGKENEENDYDYSKQVSVEWEMDLSVVYSKPGANHQGWHADGGHTEGASDAGWNDGNPFLPSSSSPSSSLLAAPYAICLFVPLIDLDHTVGFTQFWPGSHKYKDLIGFGPFAEVAKATWDGIVSAGEAIVYDYRLLHRGMPNNSGLNENENDTENETTLLHPYRAVLQLLFRQTWYKEKNNYGTESIYQAAS